MNLQVKLLQVSTILREYSFELVNKYIPATKSYDNGRMKKPIWMSHKALKAVKRKNKVFKKYKLNSTHSTGDYGRRCLTPLCPHHYQHNYIIKIL